MGGTSISPLTTPTRGGTSTSYYSTPIHSRGTSSSPPPPIEYTENPLLLPKDKDHHTVLAESVSSGYPHRHPSFRLSSSPTPASQSQRLLTSRKGNNME